MYPGYNYYPPRQQQQPSPQMQQMQMQQQIPPFLKGRPVSSLEEVRSTAPAPSPNIIEEFISSKFK